MITASNGIAATITASAVLLAAPVAAVDGEILIDQARVLAGGITPGDAPGFPATLSRPGRYKLTGNLTVPANTNGIEVTQHNVTIDLNGFTISRDPPPDKNGIVGGKNGLRVTNGTIMGFNHGIYLVGAFAVIENIRLLDSRIAGVSATGNARIHNNTIVYAVEGISVCVRCSIEQNLITYNSTGVSVSGGLVLGNAVVRSNLYGLSAYTSEPVGYGNNILFESFQAPVYGPAIQLHPNVCEPACP